MDPGDPKLGIHSDFGPNSRVESENYDSKNFGQPHCTGTCTQSNLYPIWKCSYFYLSPQDNVSVDPPLDVEATADGELLPHVPVSKRFTKINVYSHDDFRW